MARFNITYYKNSFLASVISVLSSIMGAGGGLVLAVGILDGSFEMVPTGVLLLALAAAGAILAGRISANKSNTKWWDEQIHQRNLEQEIAGSVDFCFKVYNANPCAWTLNKIEALNSGAAAQIRRALEAQKEQKNG